MRNKKILFFAIIVVVVISIILFISGIFTEKTLENIYKEINEEQTYIFKMEKNSGNKLTVAKNGNKTVIDQYTNGNHETTLVKDDITYLILHEREEYYVYNQVNDTEKNVLIQGFEEILANDNVVVGKEKVMGKKYTYQEYGGNSFFTLANIEDEQDVKTRFYFDNKGNLVYIKTLYNDEFELLRVNFETEVDDNIFEIPSHYAEN